MTAAAPPETASKLPMVPVWDRFVRVFHWSLVMLIAAAWLTEEAKTVHHWIGYAVLALVAARLVWGVIGSPHARFADFVHGPGQIFAYLRDLTAGQECLYLGHNPAGGAMIVALLTAVTATGLSGWLMLTDRFWGSGLMENIHETAATAILVLAGCHIAGVIYESVRHRENLVRSMFTGRKRG